MISGYFTYPFKQSLNRKQGAENRKLYKMNIFVARQPILNKDQNIFGYELLFRNGMENCFSAANLDEATMAVIRNALLIFGSQKLTGGKKAFINFTRNLLLSEVPGYLPQDSSVIEILETVEVDEEVLAACQELIKKGYRLALDDYVWKENEQNPLTEMVQLVKVDFLGTLPPDRQVIADFYTPKGIELLAEKVETRQDFQEALEMGYAYFQGYFFSKPEIIAGKDVPGYKLSYLEILKEICRETIDFVHLEAIIDRDPPLCLKMLTYLNSVYFGLRHEVTSIAHALTLLGEKEIRKWAALAVLSQLGQDQPKELMRLSILRAKFCESLAPKVNLAMRESELFLMGLLSLMDVFLGRPLDELLDNIALSKDIKKALLGHENAHRLVLELVVNYEKGVWESVSPLVTQLHLDENELPDTYAGAIEFVESIPLTYLE
jgi:c-di-GMP-related signal transduction protein